MAGTSAVVGGKLYAIGGSARRDVIKYNPKSDEWTMVATLKASRYESCAVGLHSGIALTGGAVDVHAVNKMAATEYLRVRFGDRDMTHADWRDLPPLNNERSGNIILISAEFFPGVIHMYICTYISRARMRRDGN